MPSTKMIDMLCGCVVLLLLISGGSGIVYYGALASSEGLWYVGKGAEEDMFVKYVITDNTLNNGHPFYVVVHFSNHINNESWTGNLVVSQNETILNITGTFDSSALDFVADSNAPPQAAQLIQIYSDTIQWLGSSNYAIKPGQRLDAKEWHDVTSIGGSPLKLEKRENVTLGAGTYETTLLTLRGQSVERSIWVDEDIPFPVKGEFVSPERNYYYELIEIGTGFPSVIPEFPLPAVFLAATIAGLLSFSRVFKMKLL